MNLESWIERFEQDWQSWTESSDETEPPDIRRAVESVPAPFAFGLLQELVKIDLELRYRLSADGSARGRSLEIRKLDDYLLLAPELKDNSAAIDGIALWEFEVRHRWGDQPPIHDFIAASDSLKPAIASDLQHILNQLSNGSQATFIVTSVEDSRDSNSDADGSAHFRNALDPQTLIETPGPGDPFLGTDNQREVVPAHTIDETRSYRPGTASRTTTFTIRKRDIAFNTGTATSETEYEIQHRVGQGGMGIVYQARQTSIDRTVALKMIRHSEQVSEEVKNRFLGEAVLTGALEHPNIIPIYDLGTTTNGDLFYAMKYVQGRVWQERIEELSEDENLDILMSIADAVAFAHSKGILHRDLKPDNVMIGSFGEVIVMDWGLAVPIESSIHRGLPVTSSAGGTPAYMAPEMTSSHSLLGTASDVYLLGALLFRVLTGTPPHKSLNDAVANTIVDTDRDDDLIRIALRCMQTDQKERFDSVLDLQSAIRESRSHAESRLLTSRASDTLAQARASHDYDSFQRSILSFREAIEIWPENEVAQRGLTAAQFEYSKSAFERGDFDLAADQLSPEQQDHSELLDQIRHASHQRLNRQRRLNMLKRVAVGLTVSVFVIVTGSAWAIHSAWQSEELAHADTRYRFGQAHHAIERLRGFAHTLRFYPRMQRERKDFLRAVAGYYRELTERPSPDARVQIELGLAMVQLGDVHTELSEHRDALDAYRGSSKVLKKLDDTVAPATLPVHRQRSEMKVAASLIRLNRYSEAGKRLAIVMKKVKAGLGKASPNDVALLKADALQQLADASALRNDFDAAEQFLSDAVTTYQKLGRAEAIRDGLAQALTRRGDVLDRAGKLESAENSIEAAISEWQQLYDNASDNPEYLEGLAAAQIDLANLMRGQGQNPLAAYEAAAHAFSQLISSRPEIPRYRFNRANAQTSLAWSLNQRHQTDEAQETCVVGINEFIELATLYPEIPDYPDGEASGRSLVGEILRDSGKHELAEDMFRLARQHYEARVQEFPDIATYRELLAVNLAELAEVKNQQGESDEAIQLYADALKHLEVPLTSDRTSLRSLDLAAWVHFKSGLLMWSESTTKEKAERHFESAIRLRSRLPETPEYSFNRAWMLIHCPDDSVQNPEAATGLLRTAVRAASGNAQFWNALALAHLNNGQIEQCETALSMAREARDVESSADWFVESLLLHAQGKSEFARERLQRGIDLMDTSRPGDPRLRILRSLAERTVDS